MAVIGLLGDSYSPCNSSSPVGLKTPPEPKGPSTIDSCLDEVAFQRRLRECLNNPVGHAALKPLNPSNFASTRRVGSVHRRILSTRRPPARELRVFSDLSA